MEGKKSLDLEIITLGSRDNNFGSWDNKSGSRDNYLKIQKFFPPYLKKINKFKNPQCPPQLFFPNHVPFGATYKLKKILKKGFCFWNEMTI